jgi:uncharacterized membrane protein YfcA
VDPTWPELVFVALLALVAATTQSTIGFGAAVVFTPLATLAVGAQSAVVTSLIFGSVISAVVFTEYRPRAPVGPIVPLALAGILATPAGIWVLARADETTLRFLVGVVVLAGAITTLTGRTRPEPRPEPLPATVGVGIVSGVMRGATSMGGPPVVLYMHWLGGNAVTIRGRLFAYFLLFSLPGVPFAFLGGVIGGRELAQALVSLPAIGVGVVIGRYARPLVSEAWYRGLSMALLALTSTVAIAGAVASAL